MHKGNITLLFLRWTGISLITPSWPALPLAFVALDNWPGTEWVWSGKTSEEEDTVDNYSLPAWLRSLILGTARLLLLWGHCFYSNSNYAVWVWSNRAPGHKHKHNPSQANSFSKIFWIRTKGRKIDALNRCSNRKTKDVTLALASNLSTAMWEKSVWKNDRVVEGEWEIREKG